MTNVASGEWERESERDKRNQEADYRRDDDISKQDSGFTTARQRDEACLESGAQTLPDGTEC